MFGIQCATGSKYTSHLYLKLRFSLTSINPLETSGLGNFSNIFASSMRNSLGY